MPTYFQIFIIVHLSGCSVQNNKVRKRALRVIHSDYNKTLEQLLEIEGLPTIHLKHLQFLMI